MLISMGTNIMEEEKELPQRLEEQEIIDIEHDIDFRPIYLSNVDFCNERYYYIDNMTNI